MNNHDAGARVGVVYVGADAVVAVILRPNFRTRRASCGACRTGMGAQQDCWHVPHMLCTSQLHAASLKRSTCVSFRASVSFLNRLYQGAAVHLYIDWFVASENRS